MWALAEVYIVTLLIDCNVAVLQLIYQLTLIVLSLVLKELERVSLGNIFPDQLVLALEELFHLVFYLLEVAFPYYDALRSGDIIIKSVLNGRTDTELRTGEQLLNGLCHKVGRRVPEGVLTAVVFPC